MTNFFPGENGNALTINDYKTLLDAINQVALVSETDIEGNIIYVNDKFIEIAKYSREELIGQNHRILKSGHQPDELFIVLWKTITGGRVWHGEIKNRAKDGTYYWVDTSIAPVLGPTGKPERYISVRFLITDKKEGEENLVNKNSNLEKAKLVMLNILEDIEEEKTKAKVLAHELEKFKVALDGTSDHVIITDPNGTVLYANASIERITGFSPKEVIGKKAGTRELWGGNMPQDFYEKLWHTVKADKKPFIGEIKNKRKDGSFYDALSSISPILDKQGNLEFIVGIERDITKEKEIDKAKSEFVSIASHQLRTPLGIVKWYLEALQGDKYLQNAPAEVKESIEEIYRSNERVLNLVRSLLSVSRIDQGRVKDLPKPLDIIELLKDIVKEVKILADKKAIELSLVLPQENIPVIEIDPIRIREVFDNLVINAIKYTPDSGKVEVKAEKSGDKCVISVKDSGIGISDDDKRRLFTKFFRADRAIETNPEGTGLGLYVAKSYVEGWGGEIKVESAEGSGSDFIVTLPLTAGTTRSDNLINKKEGGESI